MTQNLGLSHHVTLDSLLETHPEAIDFLTVRTGSLLDDAPGHDAAPALTERFRVAVHGNYLGLTAATAFDSHRARRLASLADQCVFEWVAEQLDRPTTPIPNLLDHVAERVERLQDFLGVAVLVSNSSGFRGGPASLDSSFAFLSALAERTGCGLLLDLDALCRDDRAVDATAGNDAVTPSHALGFDLHALNLDAVHGTAVSELLVDAAPSTHRREDDRVGALLMRLVAECRRLRGITIGLSPDAIRSIGTDGLVSGLDAMRKALPGRAGVVAFPGVTTTKPGLAAARPRGYLPGHGRGAPMRLVHCTPEAETPPAAGDAPPTSGG